MHYVAYEMAKISYFTLFSDVWFEVRSDIGSDMSTCDGMLCPASNSGCL